MSANVSSKSKFFSRSVRDETQLELTLRALSSIPRSRYCVSRVKLMTENSSLICNNNNFDVKPLRKYFSVNFFRV